MRYTEITEEQELEIANRLGLTKPLAPEDVEQYHNALETYRAEKDNRKNFRDREWNNTPEQDLAVYEHNAKVYQDLIAQVKTILDTPETVKLAWRAWYQDLDKYERAIREEQARPYEEFRKALDKYREELLTETKALQRKQTQQAKIRDKQTWNSDQWKAEQATLEPINAKLNLLYELDSVASSLRYEQGLTFTPELVAEKLSKTKCIVEQALKALGVNN